MKHFHLLLIITCFAYISQASIYCPNDRDIWCSDDLSNLDETGRPTLLGTDQWYIPKYIDIEFLSLCNEGRVERTWFIDYDDNDSLGLFEPSCTQILTVLKQDMPTFIEYPEDITISCDDDVDTDPPYIQSGPCEHVGYDIDVVTTTFVQDACLKIHHDYTVINWCIYDEANPQNGGIWTHTRVIKVVDEIAPVFTTCEDQSVGITDGCETLITLTQSAEDIGDCSSGTLKYYAEVDINADGTIDLQYGENQTGIFYIAPTKSGEEVTITLPESYGPSRHKVKWVVSDGCHNFASCNSLVTVSDIKAPTPYCQTFLTFAFNGDHGPLEIPVELFDIGATDNCTNTSDIQISFSSNTDDVIQTIECGEEGFKFFRIYATDAAGNSDYCEVFALVFDNGSCQGKFAPEGSLTLLDDSQIEWPNLKIYKGQSMISDMEALANGDYLFDEVDLDHNFVATIDESQGDISKIDLADLVLAQRHILGLEKLDGLALLAGDANADGSFNIIDLELLRDIILGENMEATAVAYVPTHINPLSNTSREISITDYYEGFDYLGFTRGNISDLLVAEEEDVVVFEIDRSGEQPVITNSHDIDIEGLFVSDILLPSASLEKLQIFTAGKIAEKGSLRWTLENGVKLTDAEILSQIQVVKAGSHKLAVLHPSPIDHDHYDSDQLGMEQYVSSSKKVLYPNPSSGQLYHNVDIDNVKVLDMTGKLVYKKKTNDEPTLTLDLRNLPIGLYLVQYNSEGKLQYEKVVLTR